MPGALRRSLSSSVCRGSESSRSFIGVRMLNASSRSGNRTIASISESAPFPRPMTPATGLLKGSPADEADRERHDPRHDGDEEPGLEQPPTRVDPHNRVDREARAKQERGGQQEVIAGDDPDVDAGYHHHEEHEPRTQEYGADDGEARQRRKVRVESSSMKKLASAVNRMVSEAASTSLMAVFALNSLPPNLSRKYHATPISAATTRPTPSSAIQGLASWIRLSDSSLDRSWGSKIPCEIDALEQRPRPEAYERR